MRLYYNYYFYVMYSTTYNLLQNVANNGNVFEIVSYNGSQYSNENIYSLSTITNSHLKLAPTYKKMYVEILVGRHPYST